MTKITGNEKCWAGGCPKDGGSLIICDDCVDTSDCAYKHHGMWLDCSDENRMLEVKEVTSTPDNDDRGSLETIDDIGGGCTHSHKDPFASGKKVTCCDGLEMELKDWDHDGNNHYKCVAKDTGFRCFKEFGCDNPASIDLFCDTSYLCATSCHGMWQKPC